MAEIKEMSGLGITCSGNQTKKEREKEMTREEALRTIISIGSNALDLCSEPSKSNWNRAAERIKQPITLADFLGWEEDEVYIIDTYKYKIKRGKLYTVESRDDWELDRYTTVDEIEILREAKKVGENAGFEEVEE